MRHPLEAYEGTNVQVFYEFRGKRKTLEGKLKHVRCGEYGSVGIEQEDAIFQIPFESHDTRIDLIYGVNPLGSNPLRYRHTNALKYLPAPHEQS